MTTTVAIVGDIHSNCTVAIAPPVFNLDDGGTYRASKAQRWIWKQWLAYWREVAMTRERAGGRLVVVLNGELGDVNSHDTTQLISRNPQDILRLAVETLKPALDLLGDEDRVYVTRGTEAHTGPSGHMDETLAHDIGATPPRGQGDIFSHWRLQVKVDGVRFDIAHHPPGGGGRVPWTRPNFANRLAAMAAFEYSERDEKRPHLVVRGHVHRPGDSYDAYSVRVLILPSWQLITSYGHRIGGDPLPVGGAIVVCDRGRYEVRKIYSDWPIEGYQAI